MVGRLSGPLWFRFVLQPLMAAMLAAVAGLHDARAGRPPFLWRVLSEPHQRRALMLSGWRDVGMVFAVAVVIDSAYQIVMLHFFYPLQALIVACGLAFVPYVVTRDLAGRVHSAYRRRVGR